MPTPRTVRLTAALLSAAVVLTACGDGDDPGGEPTSASSTPTSPGSTTATPPSTPSSPTAATGPEMAKKVVSLRLPEGWKTDPDDIPITRSGSRGQSVVYLSEFPSLGGQVSTDALFKAARTSLLYPGKVVRLPDTTVDGVPMARLRSSADGEYVESVVGVFRSRWQVSVDVDLKGALARDPAAIVEPVLASVRFTR